MADHTDVAGTAPSLDALPTPSLLLDRARLLANIRRVQRIADENGARLRPHIKTHKSLRIAELQRDHGAVGLTVATVAEATTFIRGGHRSITVAYPLVAPSTIEPLLRAAREHGAEPTLIFDSRHGVDAIVQTSERLGVPVDVLMKIDVGLHRCGLPEDSPELLPLARHADRSKTLRFRGLISHAGHSYGTSNRDEAAAIARDEQEILMRVRERLERDGIPVSVVSVGATPTTLSGARFDGITELRPGNYVFLDRTQIAIGVASPGEIALSVLATVVSVGRDHLIVDTGSKTLSSDRGPHGVTRLTGYGVAFRLEDHATGVDGMEIEKLSEEHGFVRHGGRTIPVGTRLRIVPNHACVVANLASVYHVIDDDIPIDRYRIDARNRELATDERPESGAAQNVTS